MRNSCYIAFFLILISCGHGTRKSTYFVYQGYAAGYPVTIEYENKAGDLSHQIKQLLVSIESAAWTGDSNSIVSKLNNHDSGVVEVNDYFAEMFGISAQYYKQTNGVIDPTLGPLLNYWGEDEGKFKIPAKTDSSVVDSLKRLTGINKYSLHNNRIASLSHSTVLHFDQLMSGYMVDKLAAMFNQYSINHYRIEVNGTIYAMGLDRESKSWLIGLDQPTDRIEDRKLLAMARLNNMAVASKGSYKKFYTKGDYRYPYIVDPKTGYPVQHSLIQVIVFAPTAVEAEVYANTFLVMGLDKSKGFLQAQSKIQAYFISANYKGEWITYVTPQLSDELEWMKIESPI